MTEKPISIADAVASAQEPDAKIAAVSDAAPSYLEGLAQGGYSAMCAAMSGKPCCDDPECCGDEPTPWASLGEMEQRAFVAFAAGVAVAQDAEEPMRRVVYDQHGRASAGGPPPSTTAPFRPRNIIDALAEHEYPENLPPDEAPSPGAAIRQLCRSLDEAPNLKRLLEDWLAANNQRSHEFTRERDERKRMELLARGFRSLTVAPDARESARILAEYDAQESTLASHPTTRANLLRSTLESWSAAE